MTAVLDKKMANHISKYSSEFMDKWRTYNGLPIEKEIDDSGVIRIPLPGADLSYRDRVFLPEETNTVLPLLERLERLRRKNGLT